MKRKDASNVGAGEPVVAKPKKKKESSKSREWERDRRERLNRSFTDLSKLLPVSSENDSPPSKKMEILQTASSYIKTLQQENSDLLKTNGLQKSYTQEVKELKSQIQELTSRLQQLAALLQEAGGKLPTWMSFPPTKNVPPPLGKRPLLYSNRLTQEDMSRIAEPKPKKRKKSTQKQPTSSNLPKKKKLRARKRVNSVTLKKPLKPPTISHQFLKPSSPNVSSTNVVLVPTEKGPLDSQAAGILVLKGPPSQPPITNPGGGLIIMHTPANPVAPPGACILLSSTAGPNQKSVASTNQIAQTTTLLTTPIMATGHPANQPVNSKPTNSAPTFLLTNGNLVLPMLPPPPLPPAKITKAIAAKPQPGDSKNSKVAIPKLPKKTKDSSTSKTSPQKKIPSLSTTEKSKTVKSAVSVTEAAAPETVKSVASVSATTSTSASKSSTPPKEAPKIAPKKENSPIKENVSKANTAVSVSTSPANGKSATHRSSYSIDALCKGQQSSDNKPAEKEKEKENVESEQQEQPVGSATKETAVEPAPKVDNQPQKEKVSANNQPEVSTQSGDKVSKTVTVPVTTLAAVSYSETSQLNSLATTKNYFDGNYENVNQFQSHEFPASDISPNFIGPPPPMATVVHAAHAKEGLEHLSSLPEATCRNNQPEQVENSQVDGMPNSFTSDIFASLHVPSGHPESISPTAAFLLAFPLVSTGRCTNEILSEQGENMPRVDNSSSIMQLGGLEVAPTPSHGHLGSLIPESSRLQDVQQPAQTPQVNAETRLTARSQASILPVSKSGVVSVTKQPSVNYSMPEQLPDYDSEITSIMSNALNNSTKYSNRILNPSKNKGTAEKSKGAGSQPRVSDKQYASFTHSAPNTAGTSTSEPLNVFDHSTLLKQGQQTRKQVPTYSSEHTQRYPASGSSRYNITNYGTPICSTSVAGLPNTQKTPHQCDSSHFNSKPTHHKVITGTMPNFVTASSSGVVDGNAPAPVQSSSAISSLPAPITALAPGSSSFVTQASSTYSTHSTPAPVTSAPQPLSFLNSSVGSTVASSASPSKSSTSYSSSYLISNAVTSSISTYIYPTVSNSSSNRVSNTNFIPAPITTSACTSASFLTPAISTSSAPAPITAPVSSAPPSFLNTGIAPSRHYNPLVFDTGIKPPTSSVQQQSARSTENTKSSQANAALNQSYPYNVFNDFSTTNYLALPPLAVTSSSVVTNTSDTVPSFGSFPGPQKSSNFGGILSWSNLSPMPAPNAGSSYSSECYNKHIHHTNDGNAGSGNISTTFHHSSTRNQQNNYSISKDFAVPPPPIMRESMPSVSREFLCSTSKEMPAPVVPPTSRENSATNRKAPPVSAGRDYAAPSSASSNRNYVAREIPTTNRESRVPASKEFNAPVRRNFPIGRDQPVPSSKELNPAAKDFYAPPNIEFPPPLLTHGNIFSAPTRKDTAVSTSRDYAPPISKDLMAPLQPPPKEIFSTTHRKEFGGVSSTPTIKEFAPQLTKDFLPPPPPREMFPTEHRNSSANRADFSAPINKDMPPLPLTPREIFPPVPHKDATTSVNREFPPPQPPKDFQPLQQREIFPSGHRELAPPTPRPPVNWMTTPDLRHESAQNPFGHDQGVLSQREPSSASQHQNAPNSFLNNYPDFTENLGHMNWASSSKSTIPHPPLPTLFGDLALGPTPPTPQKACSVNYRSNARKPDKPDFNKPASKPVEVANPSFLSVSQLVDHNVKGTTTQSRNKPKPNASKGNRGSRDRNKNNAVAQQPPQPHSLPFNDTNLCPSISNWPGPKLSYKATPSSYSAEALIGLHTPQQQQSELMPPPPDKNYVQNYSSQASYFSDTLEYPSCPNNAGGYQPANTNYGNQVFSELPSNPQSCSMDTGNNFLLAPNPNEESRLRYGGESGSAKASVSRSKKQRTVPDQAYPESGGNNNNYHQDSSGMRLNHNQQLQQQMQTSGARNDASHLQTVYPRQQSQQQGGQIAASNIPVMHPTVAGPSLTNFNLSAIFPEINDKAPTTAVPAFVSSKQLPSSGTTLIPPGTSGSGDYMSLHSSNMGPFLGHNPPHQVGLGLKQSFPPPSFSNMVPPSLTFPVHEH